MELPRLRSTDKTTPSSAVTTGRSTETTDDTPPRHRFEPSMRHKPESQPKKRFPLKWAIIVTVALLALAAYVFLSGKMTSNPYIDSNKYQAVFFTNGQVYFGKLKSLDNNYLQLKDVFYIQAAKSSSDNPQDASDAKEQDNNMELVKLGSIEIHGPDDEMIINRDQVLFFENLKNDGKVSKTIEQYKASNKN